MKDFQHKEGRGGETDTDRRRSQPHQLGDVWREGLPYEGEKTLAVLRVVCDAVYTPPKKTVRQDRLLELHLFVSQRQLRIKIRSGSPSSFLTLSRKSLR